MSAQSKKDVPLAKKKELLRIRKAKQVAMKKMIELRNKREMDRKRRERSEDTPEKSVNPKMSADTNERDEIDDIFSKRSEVRPRQTEKKTSKGNNKRKLDDEQDWTGKERKKQARYTNDGLKIYTLEELGINKGRDTPLCPFDCDCCH